MRGRETRLKATVQAESIERAVRLAVARYPDVAVGVLVPIDPKTFFAAGNDTSPTVSPVVGAGLDAQRV